MTVKSVVVALALLASTTLAAGAQTRKPKRAAKAAAKPAPAPANLHFTVAPTGNEARYRVRETLVEFKFPTDAIGKTQKVTGTIVVSPDGKIVSDSSLITIDAQSIKSDKGARDRTLKTQSLMTDKYPTITFVPTSFAGLTAKPGATDAAFTLTGNLTVAGNTHPVTWDVKAHSVGNDILGSAATHFTFDYMGITPPKKPILFVPVGVADTIKLEYDFHFTQQP